MNNANIFSDVQEVCSTILRVPKDRISMETKLVDDLDVDSLFLTELAVELEEQFSIQVDETEMPGISTIGDLVEYVKNAPKAS